MNQIFIKKCNNLTLLLVLVFIPFFGCSSLDIVPHETDLANEKRSSDGRGRDTEAKSFLELFEGDLFGQNQAIGFNSITFEVALDKLSIMPLMTADKASGIITTDWFSVSDNKNTKVKFNILIKDDDMNDDSIVVNMFKETFNGNTWITADINEETVQKIKQSILEQARTLQAAADLS